MLSTHSSEPTAGCPSPNATVRLVVAVNATYAKGLELNSVGASGCDFSFTLFIARSFFDTLISIVSPPPSPPSPPPRATFTVGGSSSTSTQAEPPILVFPAPPTGVNPVVVGSSVGAATFLVAAILGGIYRLRVLRRQAAEAALIESALASNSTFQYPLHMLRASDFLNAEKLQIFEDVRASGKHIVIDLGARSSVCLHMRVHGKKLNDALRACCTTLTSCARHAYSRVAPLRLPCMCSHGVHSA